MVPRLRANALVCLTIATIGLGAAFAPFKQHVDSPVKAATTTLPEARAHTRRPDLSSAEAQRRATVPGRAVAPPIAAANQDASLTRTESFGLTRIESFGLGVGAALSIIVAYLGVRILRQLAGRAFRRRRPIGA